MWMVKKMSNIASFEKDCCLLTIKKVLPEHVISYYAYVIKQLKKFSEI